MFVSEFDLRSFLCSESEQLIWKSQGLPSDDLSMENALVILQVRQRFPFCFLSYINLPQQGKWVPVEGWDILGRRGIVSLIDVVELKMKTGQTYGPECC